MIKNKFENGGEKIQTPISESQLDLAWSLSMLTGRKGRRSLKNSLRRTVHCLRRSPHAQDRAFIFFTSCALARLNFGLRPVVKFTREAKTGMWLEVPVDTGQAEPTNGCENSQ